jgi:hypothetical protein
MSRNGNRTLIVGTFAVCVGAVSIALPLVIVAGTLNKFLVAFGFIGVCWGLSCLLNGTWDYLKARGKR